MPIHIKLAANEPAESVEKIVAGCVKLIAALPDDLDALASTREYLEHERGRAENIGFHQSVGVLTLTLACVECRMQ